MTTYDTIRIDNLNIFYRETRETGLPHLVLGIENSPKLRTMVQLFWADNTLSHILGFKFPTFASVIAFGRWSGTNHGYQIGFWTGKIALNVSRCTRILEYPISF